MTVKRISFMRQNYSASWMNIKACHISRKNLSSRFRFDFQFHQKAVPRRESSSKISNFLLAHFICNFFIQFSAVTLLESGIGEFKMKKRSRYMLKDRIAGRCLKRSLDEVFHVTTQDYEDMPFKLANNILLFNYYFIFITIAILFLIFEIIFHLNK